LTKPWYRAIVPYGYDIPNCVIIISNMLLYRHTQ